MKSGRNSFESFSMFRPSTWEKKPSSLQFGASDQPDEQLVAVGLAVEHPKWSPLDVFTPPPPPIIQDISSSTGGPAPPRDVPHPERLRCLHSFTITCISAAFTVSRNQEMESKGHLLLVTSR